MEPAKILRTERSAEESRRKQQRDQARRSRR
jgi:hypothetical protein